MADGEWDFEINAEAERECNHLPTDALRQEALDTIEALTCDPFPPDSIELRRNNNVWRVYFGNDRYRILYRVNRRKRMFQVFRIRPRGTAYRAMRNPRAS